MREAGPEKLHASGRTSIAIARIAHITGVVDRLDNAPEGSAVKPSKSMAFGYIRVSDRDQVQRHSFDAQERR